jgi:hypothetical protein
VLLYRIRDNFIRFPKLGSPTHLSEGIVTDFLGKIYVNSLPIGSNFFLILFKNKNKPQFCEIYRHKKGKTKIFFPVFFFIDVGSGIRDPG